MSRLLKIGLVQQSSHLSRKLALEATEKGIVETARQGAGLVLLQELHAGIYFCQHENQDTFNLAEEIPGETSNFLSKLAKQHKLVIVGSIFEKRAPGMYHNTAIVFEKDGSIAGKYRKMHIPDDPGYYEKYFFTPGDLGFTPIQTSVGKLGVLVCWDQWFPEAARIMALRGAEILLYPTAIGWYPEDDQKLKEELVDSWVTIQRSHSIANCVPVASCNRVSFEPDESGATSGILFWGNSFITDTHGEVIAKATHDKEQVLVAEVDLGKIEATRKIWPYLRDRRVDFYQDLLKKYAD